MKRSETTNKVHDDMHGRVNSQKKGSTAGSSSITPSSRTGTAVIARTAAQWIVILKAEAVAALSRPHV